MSANCWDMMQPRWQVIQIARDQEVLSRLKRIGCRSLRPAGQSPAAWPAPNPAAPLFLPSPKFDGILPLFASTRSSPAMGADIPETTLGGWCGRAMKTLRATDRTDEAESWQRLAARGRHADAVCCADSGSLRDKRGFGKGVRDRPDLAYCARISARWLDHPRRGDLLLRPGSGGRNTFLRPSCRTARGILRL